MRPRQLRSNSQARLIEQPNLLNEYLSLFIYHYPRTSRQLFQRMCLHSQLCQSHRLPSAGLHFVISKRGLEPETTTFDPVL